MKLGTIRLPWMKSLAGVAALLLGTGLSATPKPPPLLCLDDVECVEAGERYRMEDALAGVPFSVNLPALPNITSEANVTPATIAANKVNGRRLILGPGDYGDQTFGTQDQEIVLTPGASIRLLSISNDARRLRFTAAPIRSGSIAYFRVDVSAAPEDIILDGINQTYGGSIGRWDGNMIHGRRIAVINSSTYALAQALASFPANQAAALHDVVIANNILWAYGESGAGGQSVTRFHGPRQMVYADNRVVKTGSDHHTFRIHAAGSGLAQSNNIYVARNQFEKSPQMLKGSDGATPNNSGIGSVWYEGNDLYFGLGWAYPIQMEAAVTEHPTFFSLRNNRLFSSNGNWPPRYESNWVYENNQSLPYQNPPPWSFR